MVNVMFALIASASIGPGGVDDGVRIAKRGESLPIVELVRSGSGRVVEGSRARRGAGGRGTGEVVVFDNYENSSSTTGLNVSYVNLGSYSGEDPSNLAFILPMAERLRSRAPQDAASGFLGPTDIVWNEYQADMTRWPGGPGGGLARLVRLSIVLSNYNLDPPPNGGGTPIARWDTLRLRFFSSDKSMEFGGFDVIYYVPASTGSYFGDDLDLSNLSPPIFIPPSGYIMLDWAEPNISGVGSMFAGGDFIAPGYPSPESLRRVGLTHTLEMWWTDGVIGAAGWPNQVDNGFDGDPSNRSYLDIFNTGLLANWNFGMGDPPVRQLCRDFPCRLVVATDAACPCDVDNSSSLNSQDFFDFITDFFSGAADFNHSGFTDSQDFFDFLVCFFEGC